jgi:hypothetical protein
VSIVKCRRRVLSCAEKGKGENKPGKLDLPVERLVKMRTPLNSVVIEDYLNLTISCQKL